ncbi:MAG: dual specificity protein phosphatase family protein [Planctomycetota bacterium]
MRCEIHWVNGVPSGRLAVMPRPRGGDWLEDEVASLKDVGVDVLVSLLTDEEITELGLQEEARACAKLAVKFVRFPIEDRSVPAGECQAERLIRELAAIISEGGSVAVHCRMGVGRSALVAASILTVLGHTTDAAFEAVRAARGIDVPDTQEQRDWVARFPEDVQRDAP